MKVSVVITAWNAAWCIERALDSLMAQTRPPDEILLGDDGSTDDTVARVEARYGDRVRILRLPHRGLTPSRKAGLEAAMGDWLALMDADDAWMPAKLERQVRFLEQHPEVRWISTDGTFAGAEGVLRESWMADYFHPVTDLCGDLYPHLVERCFPLVSSMMIERKAYDESGGFDPAIPYSQDYDLWLRLASRHPGAVIGEPLILYWSSPGQLSRRIEERHRDDLLLMERVAAGTLRRDPAVQRRGAFRVAELEFGLAMRCLRSGREAEARERFRRAWAFGPPRRRLIAAAASVLPVRMLGALGRWSAARREPVTAAADVKPGKAA